MAAVKIQLTGGGGELEVEGDLETVREAWEAARTGSGLLEVKTRANRMTHLVNADQVQFLRATVR